jgi:hypothetical protein
MEEQFIKTGHRLFVGHALPSAAEEERRFIESEIARQDDDAVLAADLEEWAAALSVESRLEAPRVDTDRLRRGQSERIEVDCSGAAGIGFSLMEINTGAMRPGYLIDVEVPVDGNRRLLETEALGAPRIPGDIMEKVIRCEWTWPDEKGPEALQQDIEEWRSSLRQGVETIARLVEAANASFEPFAREKIEERRGAILAERSFLGELSIPVLPAEDAPEDFGAPPIRRVDTPAQEIVAPAEAPAGAELRPVLGEFYEHILSLIRAVGRGLERSPGSFSGVREEDLRDLTLVTLNTHYVGVTYAEAFNRSGKTDLLIGVYDKNAFIGECKWWEGAKEADRAIDQLLGYTTWEDARLALIFYVRTKAISTATKAAGKVLEDRDEFIEWIETGEEREMRCRIAWPDDPERSATLATVFVHLPPAPR